MAHLYIAARHRCTADTAAVRRRWHDKFLEGHGFLSSFGAAGETLRRTFSGSDGGLSGRCLVEG